MKTALNRLLSYEQPQKYIVETENYSETFSTPVLTAGKSFILGYTNETTGVYNGKESPVIIFDDFTGDKKYVDFDFKVKSSAMKLLHKVNTSDNLKYLFYALQSIKYTPFSHKRIWISEYSNFLIEYRHPQEQNAIVLALDGINQAIYNKKQELFSLDELVKSRFIEMFGEPLVNEYNFPKKKLSDTFLLSAGGTPKTDKKEYWDNGTISWIGSNMCQNQILYQNDGKYITELGLKNSSAKIFDVDTVLIALVGATIGKTALLKFPTATNQNVLGIQKIANAAYNPYFVYYYMQGLYDRFIDLGDGKFKMASKGFVGDLEIFVVDLHLQNEFAEFVKLIDKSKFVCHSKNFLCDIFTFSSSTIAYPSVVSIFVCPKRC